MELRKFVGNGEPEFEGAIEGAAPIDTDAGNSPLDDFLQAVVILGGSGNNRGVILGGYLFYLFSWTTQQVKGYVPSDVNLRLDYLNQIIVGVLLIVFILFRPEGVLPEKKYLPAAMR